MENKDELDPNVTCRRRRLYDEGANRNKITATSPDGSVPTQIPNMEQSIESSMDTETLTIMANQSELDDKDDDNQNTGTPAPWSEPSPVQHGIKDGDVAQTPSGFPTQTSDLRPSSPQNLSDNHVNLVRGRAMNAEQFVVSSEGCAPSEQRPVMRKRPQDDTKSAAAKVGFKKQRGTKVLSKGLETHLWRTGGSAKKKHNTVVTSTTPVHPEQDAVMPTKPSTSQGMPTWDDGMTERQQGSLYETSEIGVKEVEGAAAQRPPAMQNLDGQCTGQASNIVTDGGDDQRQGNNSNNSSGMQHIRAPELNIQSHSQEELVCAVARAARVYSDEAGLNIPLSSLNITHWKGLIHQAQQRFHQVCESPHQASMQDAQIAERNYVSIVAVWVTENVRLKMSKNGLQDAASFAQGILGDSTFIVVLKGEHALLGLLNEIIQFSSSRGSEKVAVDSLENRDASVAQNNTNLNSTNSKSDTQNHKVIMCESFLQHQAVINHLRDLGVCLCEREEQPLMRGRETVGTSQTFNFLLDESTAVVVVKAIAINETKVNTPEMIEAGLSNVHLIVWCDDVPPGGHARLPTASIDTYVTDWISSVISAGLNGHVHQCFGAKHVAVHLHRLMDLQQDISMREGAPWHGCDVTEVVVKRDFISEFKTEWETVLSNCPGFNAFSAQICLAACPLSRVFASPQYLGKDFRWISPRALDFLRHQQSLSTRLSKVI